MTDLLTALKTLWPHGDQHVPGLIEGIAASAPTVFPKYGLDTPIVIAHAMAQFSHECGAGLEMVENLNYTAVQLRKQWPSHFTGDMPERYAHNPRMIADVAYGGRMGNAPPPSDDGWNYRGRGLSQVTGRKGYEALAEKTGLDLLGNPDFLSDSDHALACGVADFILCGCLPWAEKDDVMSVSAALNVGDPHKHSAVVGAAARIAWLRKWKAELGA